MKQKIKQLQSFFLVLLLSVMSTATAWADTTYQLIDRTSTPVLDLTHFRTSLSLNNGSQTFSETSLNKYVRFGSALSSLSGMDGWGKAIAYDVKTTITKIKVYAYASSSGTLIISEVKEGDGTEAKVAAQKKTCSVTSTPTIFEYDATNSKNSTIYIYASGNTNAQIYQVEAIESGTALPTGGGVDYELSFNKGRAFLASGAASYIDGVEVVNAANYKPVFFEQFFWVCQQNNVRYLTFLAKPRRLPS